MSEFAIKKEELVELVDRCQNRSFAEQIELLTERNAGSSNWLIKGLASDEKNGILGSEEDCSKRIEAFGSNQKKQSEPPGFWELFCGALEDLTMRILIVASFLSIAIEVGTAKPNQRATAWIEGFAVLVAVAICATVTAVNDYQKERQFLKLNSVADSRKRVTVRRKGEQLEMHQDSLLVGDVVQLNEGMEIPADGYLLEANEISTDESAMTGETDPVHKNTLERCIKKYEEIIANGQKNISGKHDVPSPILMSGTRLLTGQGKMVVLVVGEQSCLGKIQALLGNTEAEATPLQMKLEAIAEDIGKFGLYSAIAIVTILLIRFAIEKGISRTWDTSVDLVELLNYFILGITVIVVAIPEGLPLAVTLSLAFSVKKMLLDNNLVRKMEACETMGGANVICSDKTGTLTMNKMTLTSYWSGKRIEFKHYEEKLDHREYMNDQFAELFSMGCCVNSTALLRPEVKGSSTEVAILKLLQKCGYDYEKLREKYPTLLKYPFSSKRKRMSSLIDYKGQKTLLVKGASELILECCEFWYNQQTNQVEPLTEQVRNRVNKGITNMAEQSLRTLCVAYKGIGVECLETKDSKGVFDVEKNHLVLLAVLGVKDVPRPEVPEAIIKCRNAGIKVKMVTGDNLVTARAIAREVGIIQEGQDSLVMEGPDFIKIIGGVVCAKCLTAVCNCERDPKIAEQNKKDVRVDTIKKMDEFKRLMKNLDVLARSRPEDKYALVTGLKELGNVVAVTGDGTNDAPALKKADVGFAMGINGTEVAREASAIILLDDNFNSIVKAVMWGRNIYDAIKKFIQFQLTVNVVAVCITLIGAAIIKQEVLKPIQMLWINLIMDTLASLALATEPPTEKLLDRAPHGRDDYIISKKMFKHIICQSLFQLIVMITLIFAGELIIPEAPDSFDAVIGTDLSAKYLNGVVGGTVRSGRFNFVAGGADYFPVFDKYRTYSRHFTFIFNTFVMLQVFNFLNCRKLNDEMNIFEGITRNLIFVLIVISIFVLQIILVTFGSTAMGVYSNYGLNVQQWLLSAAFGSVSLLINVLAKLIPQNKVCLRLGTKQADPLQNKEAGISLKRKMSSFQRNLSLNRAVH